MRYENSEKMNKCAKIVLKIFTSSKIVFDTKLFNRCAENYMQKLDYFFIMKMQKRDFFKIA